MADPALAILSETGYGELVRHLPESVLEEYALRRLTDYRAERVEEHVASCSECRKRLETEIGIVALVKTAGKRLGVPPGRKRAARCSQE